MTISAYGLGALSVQRATDTFRTIKSDLEQVQGQLSTGKSAQTFAGLGTAASAALRLGSRLSTLGSYASNVTDAQLRLQLMTNGVQQIAKLTGALPAGLSATGAQSTIGQNSVAVSARDGLSQIIDVLNTQLNGRYLFAGRASDTEPVASYDLMMDGDATHAGLKTVIAERKAADLGSDGMGRLALTSSASSVTLSEEAAGLPFGIKIAGATTAGSGAISATLTAGPPASAGITLGAQPVDGDTVEIQATLPDGSSATIRLVAGSGTSANTGAVPFAVGATPDDTASNLAAALGTAVQSLASATLASASAVKAASDFFDGTATAPTMRVAGPPYDTATALVPGTTANTVTWYSGDSSSSARDTAPVRIGDSQTVGIGAEACEPAFRAALVSYGVLAADSFPPSDPTSRARYQALADRVTAKLSPDSGTQSVQDVTTDFAGAATTLKDAQSRLRAASNQAQDALSAIQDADPNEAAMKLLDTQTRLQASYQTTATLQKLSLVNYL